jgi:Elongation factor Tu C-terminal domain
MLDSFNSNQPQYELEAEIYYLTTAEGGRANPVYSGYRGQFYYDDKNWDAPQSFIDKEICYPGETVKVNIQTLSPHAHVGRFFVGKEFETREGNRVVGRGKITKIIRQDFCYWDFDMFFKQLPSDCKPYDEQSIDSFRVNFEHYLKQIKGIKSIEIRQNLADKNQMITVTCNTETTDRRALIQEICACWHDKLAFKNTLYKTEFNLIENILNFELNFVTWHSMYATGKIILL